MKPCFVPLVLGSLVIISSSLRSETPAVIPPVAPPPETPATPPITPAAVTPVVPSAPAFPELKKQQEQLTLETSIADLQLKKELSALAAEKQRRELETALAQQKQQAELATLQAQIQKLTIQTDLLGKQRAAEDAERKARLDNELAELREKIERARVANDLASAEAASRQRELQLQDQELSVRSKEILTQRAEFDVQVAKLNAEIDLREKRDLWKTRVDRDIQYTTEPFSGGVLTISDRRIPLNGPIYMDTADYVQERIDYFNNQDQSFPIFLVIDRSPGGSVMAGYKILKAMDGSPAPVYVVVKSFAASMAAGITTLAKKSYAYPNAIILHHQILSVNFGNLTEQRENVKDLEEWWVRLASPVAKKMGVSLPDFIAQMYKNRSTGDWEVFGDEAKRLKWVDEIVETIREESLVKNPDLAAKPSRSGTYYEAKEEIDSEGHRYISLPRLDPVDRYYLYNPDRYYRNPR